MIFFTFFLFTIDPAHHIYNIHLTENVFEWNLFISKFSSAAPMVGSNRYSIVIFHTTTNNLTSPSPSSPPCSMPQKKAKELKAISEKSRKIFGFYQSMAQEVQHDTTLPKLKLFVVI